MLESIVRPARPACTLELSTTIPPFLSSSHREWLHWPSLTVRKTAELGSAGSLGLRPAAAAAGDGGSKEGAKCAAGQQSSRLSVLPSFRPSAPSPRRSEVRVCISKARGGGDGRFRKWKLNSFSGFDFPARRLRGRAGQRRAARRRRRSNDVNVSSRAGQRAGRQAGRHYDANMREGASSTGLLSC